MVTGENFKRINGNATIKILKDTLIKTQQIFWQYLKNNEFTFDKKAVQLENDVKLAEYELYCTEYEDNRKRNWK